MGRGHTLEPTLFPCILQCAYGSAPYSTDEWSRDHVRSVKGISSRKLRNF